MRIVIAVHHFPPSHTGGAEWSAYRLAANLQTQGHQVRVVCVERIDAGPEGAVAVESGIYEQIPVRRLSYNLASAPDPFQWTYNNPWIGRYMRDMLSEYRPDVLHLISGYLLSGSTPAAATELGVPTVVTLSDYWFLCPCINLMQMDGHPCTPTGDLAACALCLRKIKRRYRLLDQLSGGWAGHVLQALWQRQGDSLIQALVERRRFLLQQLNAADMLLAPSHSLKTVYLAHGIGPERFRYLNQGLDLDNWLETEPQISKSCLRIGYVGQIAPHKGIDVLIEAFRRLQPTVSGFAQLVIYGDTQQFPGYTARLRRQAEHRGDIIFAGPFVHSHIRRVHAAIDVLVVPSLWCESSPNVILEALALGTPLIASDVAGITELVQHQVNGLLFPAGDVRALTRQLQGILDNPAILRPLHHPSSQVKTIQEETRELLDIYRAAQQRKVQQLKVAAYA